MEMQEQKSQPLFSIIMPCYNSEEYLETAIDSVRAQRYSNWELITINDGSTDRTERILNSYTQKDPRIRSYSKQNGGYCSAINAGLKHIRGEYFLLMGSDDKLFDNVLLEMSQAVVDFKPDLIGFRTIKYRDGECLGLDTYTNFYSLIKSDHTTIKEFEKEYSKEAKIFFIRDTSKAFKSSLLGQLEYFGTYGFDADGIFTMMFAHKAHSFMLIPVDGYAWTLRNDSVSNKSKMTKELYKDRLNNWRRYYFALIKMDKAQITMHDIYYIDYYYDLVWEYAKAIGSNELKIDKKFLHMQCKSLFLIMRRFHVSVGKTTIERLCNYLSLIFPEIKRSIFHR